MLHKTKALRTFLTPLNQQQNNIFFLGKSRICFHASDVVRRMKRKENEEIPDDVNQTLFRALAQHDKFCPLSRRHRPSQFFLFLQRKLLLINGDAFYSFFGCKTRKIPDTPTHAHVTPSPIPNTSIHGFIPTRQLSSYNKFNFVT